MIEHTSSVAKPDSSKSYRSFHSSPAHQPPASPWVPLLALAASTGARIAEVLHAEGAPVVGLLFEADEYKSVGRDNSKVQYMSG